MDIQEDLACIATLDQFKGVGVRSILRIIKAFSTAHLLRRASPSQLEEALGKQLATPVLSLLECWDGLHEAALQGLSHSAEKGVRAIPITSETYPPLLKLIDAPPPILYARGEVALLKHVHAVAIVGTREPTMQGYATAYAFAQRWASSDYVVISGLAKGIDTAAHQGALSARGKAIVVLGTSLDKIYPAVNKGLAQRILDTGGLLLSELMVGRAGSKNAFVARDRLQSGLSLCVFPIQTALDGGTMHTVRFAEKQRRYVICLRPAPEEAFARQYEGIWSLIHERKRLLDPAREEHFERCLQMFPLLLRKLLRETSELLQGEKETH